MAYQNYLIDNPGTSKAAILQTLKKFFIDIGWGAVEKTLYVNTRNETVIFPKPPFIENDSDLTLGFFIEPNNNYWCYVNKRASSYDGYSTNIASMGVPLRIEIVTFTNGIYMAFGHRDVGALYKINTQNNTQFLATNTGAGCMISQGNVDTLARIITRDKTSNYLNGNTKLVTPIMLAVNQKPLAFISQDLYHNMGISASICQVITVNGTKFIYTPHFLIKQ